MTAAAPPPLPAAPNSRQQGLVLPLALILLVVLTLAGVGAARVNILQERMVAATHNRQLAFQAAEAALREGERFLQQNPPAFNGSGGLYPSNLVPLPSAPPVWDGWSASAWSSNGITYGGSLGEVAAQPVYIIEELASLSCGSLDLGAPLKTIKYYRITARAVGGDPNSVVLLQSFYKGDCPL